MAHIITSQNDSTPKETLTRNWGFLNKCIGETIQALSFDAEEEIKPRTQLVKARTELRKVEARIIEQRITRLGRFKIRSEIGFVINSINGIRQGIIDKNLSKAKVNKMLPALTKRLRTVVLEIAVRADKEAQDIKVSQDYEALPERMQEPTAPKLFSKPIRSKEQSANVFHDINDAMQSLRNKNTKQAQKERDEIKRKKESDEKRSEEEMRMALDNHKREQESFPGVQHLLSPPGKDFSYLQDKRRHTRDYVRTQKEINDEAEASRARLGVKKNSNWENTIPESPTLWEARDIDALTHIREAFEPQLAAMKSSIKNAAIHDQTGNYIMLHGPVAVIANPGPGIKQLERSGIKHILVRTPATQLGANPGGKREPTNTIIILLDQVLIAVGIKPPAKVKPKDPKLHRMPVIPSPKKPMKSSTYEPENIDLLRGTLAATLSMKLGGDWMDILKENQTKTGPFILDKNFPHTRFIWFIRRSSFNKIAPMKIEQIGFPFSGS